MPTIPLIVMLLVMLSGFVIIFIGVRIWFQRKISYLHIYHRDKIKAEDIPVFAKKTGQAVILIGVGIFLSSLLFILTESIWSWCVFALCFLIGIGLLVRTAKKYNGYII